MTAEQHEAAAQVDVVSPSYALSQPGSWEGFASAALYCY